MLASCAGRGGLEAAYEKLIEAGVDGVDDSSWGLSRPSVVLAANLLAH
jgi:hypothetical protein